VRIQLWDTAGQERYGALSKLFFRGAAAVILVIDSTNVRALEGAEKWLKLARECASPDAIVLLLSNKSDLFGSDGQQRAVARSDVDAFAAQHQLVHVGLVWNRRDCRFGSVPFRGAFLASVPVRFGSVPLQRESESQLKLQCFGVSFGEDFSRGVMAPC
jgi:GTPase SAR1 family protein